MKLRLSAFGLCTADGTAQSSHPQLSAWVGGMALGREWAGQQREFLDVMLTTGALSLSPTPTFTHAHPSRQARLIFFRVPVSPSRRLGRTIAGDRLAHWIDCSDRLWPSRAMVLRV